MVLEERDAREELKGNLLDYIERVLHAEKSKSGGYVCPLCGSGTGENGTGAFMLYDNEKRWKCFSCGGTGVRGTGSGNDSGDIFDLVGKVEGIPTLQRQLKRIAELYGITVDYSNSSSKPSQIEKGAQTVQIVSKPLKQAETAETEEPNFAEFFKQAAANIGSTSYHRGISLETLKRYNVGYVAEWKNPKAQKNVSASPRLIIPTSPTSYIARDTRAAELIPEYQKQYIKMKAGKVHIFNAEILETATRPIFVTEGEIDALSLLDVGLDALATGSTANINIFLKQLEEHRPKQPLILAFDDDEAGKKATETLIQGLESKDIFFYRSDTSVLYGGEKDANAALNSDRIKLKEYATAIENDALKAFDKERQEEKDEIEKSATVYHLQEFIQHIQDSKRNKAISTGISHLDYLLDGGLYAGLYVVGAISSLGKTTFVLQIADNIAQQGHDVLIFSLEMATDELIAKSVSRLTALIDLESSSTMKHAKTTRGILTGSFYASYSEIEKNLIQKATEEFAGYAKNLYIKEGVGNIGIDEISAEVKKHIEYTGRKPVVIIDYLQILAPYDAKMTDKQNTDKAVLELKRLTRDHNIPVIAISSFNRENYVSPVSMASFKESGAIEYSSDVLIGLQYKGMDYQNTEKLEAKEIHDKRVKQMLNEIGGKKETDALDIQIKILKNRNGKKGTSDVNFYPAFNYFFENFEINSDGTIDCGDEWESIPAEKIG